MISLDFEIFNKLKTDSYQQQKKKKKKKKTHPTLVFTMVNCAGAAKLRRWATEVKERKKEMK